MKKVILALAILAFSYPSFGAVQTYSIDSEHSQVAFKIRHLFSKVPGRFTKFEGRVKYDAKNPSKGSINVTIDANSINTDNTKRDDHLRGKEFFWTEKYPKITFKSTKIKASKEKGKLIAEGNLTMRGVTKPVVLEIEVLGFGKDPWGNEKASFEAQTTIDRKDFEIVWNETLDKGGYLLGEKVEIELGIEGNLEATKK